MNLSTLFLIMEPVKPIMQNTQSFIEYQVKSGLFPLNNTNLKPQSLEALQPIRDGQTSKLSNEQRTTLVQQIFDALSFCKQPDFAQYLCVRLTEICQSDLRLEGMISSSAHFEFIFDSIKAATRQTVDQQMSFGLFCAIVCKRLQPEHPRFTIVREIFFDYFHQLLTTIPKDQIQVQCTQYMIVNRFLRNEYLFAQLFAPGDNLSYDAFYNNKVRISADPIKKILDIFVEQIKDYQPTIIYPILITIWMFTFHDGVCEQMLQSGLVSIILRAVGLRNIQQNSKLIRAICLTLGNIKQNMKAINQIVAANGQRLLQQLTTLTWPADTAIEQTLLDVLKNIQQNVTESSTIQKYKTELDGQVLEMSPLHSNAAFWKANAQQFTADQAVLMHKLIKIGENALEKDDRTTIRVVLNDFGMFVANHPQGREWAERLPGMLKVSMGAMRVEDEELQALAIQTTSRLLLNKVV